MDVKQLMGFVLLIVLVGLITGVGVLTFDKFGEATRVNTTITNEALTTASGTDTLANTNVNSLTFFGNKTINTSTSGITIGSQVNYTSAGVITVDANNFTDGDYNASYAYGASSTTTTAMSNMTSALADIPNTWLGLLITIVVLSIILTLVIRSFSGR